MVEGGDFMDELFQRINQLEEENKILNKKIIEQDIRLKEKKEKEMLKGINEKELLGGLDLDENKDNTNTDNRMDIDLPDLNKKFTNPNMEEVEIIYTPYEDINKIYIKGDFTKWEKKEMRKEDGVFFYSILLLKGYRYFYSFLVQEQMLVDFENDYTENTKTGYFL